MSPATNGTGTPARDAPTGGSARPRRWDTHEPPVNSVGLKLFLLAVFLMPLQLELPGFKDVLDTRLPPGDIALAVSLLAAPTALKLRAKPVALLPVALILTLCWGILLALLYTGNISDHAIMVKLVGAIVLGVWCLTTVSYTLRGHAYRILRVWLLGMVIWGAVAYIDWKYFDLVGFLDAKTPTRFGGMQFDPNNAGAAYAVGIMVVWKFGRRAFTHRSTQIVVALLFILFATQTYSRGAYIGIAASVVVVLAIGKVGVVRWARYALMCAIVLIGVFATGLVDDSQEEWGRRPDTVGSRNALVEEGLDRFADSKGLGIGLGTYRLEVEFIIHNTVIWLLIEMSIVGILFFFAMAAVPFEATLRIRRFDPDLALALLGGHAVMLVTSAGIEALYQRQWWMIIGLCAAPLPAWRAKEQHAPADQVPAASEAG